MFSPFHNIDYPDDPTPVGPSHIERDVVGTTQIVDMESDTESDTNHPGELTFREGQSLQKLCAFEKVCLTHHARYCWRNGPPHGCLQLHHVEVRTFPSSLSPLRITIIILLYFLTFPSALAASSARVYSPLHRPSSSLSGLSAHP